MSLRLRLYVAGVMIAATALLGSHVPHAFATQWTHYVAWVVICLVSETMWSTTLSGNATWSLSATAGLSAVVLFGPAAGIWVSAVSTLIADLFVLRKALVRAAFNAGQIALTAWVAGMVFQWTGGPSSMPHSLSAATQNHDVSGLVMPFLGLLVTYWMVNRALVSLAVAWSGERSWWRTLREDWLYLARLEVDAASFLLCPLMVISYTAVGYPGVLLFYAPLFMLFQSDRRFGELKKAEEQNLLNAQFVGKGELAAEIGHEINNRLVAIVARAQQLLKDVERERYENIPRYASIILEQSKHMGVIAKGLADYTRSAVNIEPMDLNGLLQSTVDFVKTEKRFEQVEWELDLDPALPEMRADLGQLQGVFINLFANAADAMGKQETRRAITVHTRYDERARTAEVVVSDSGPGIKAEYLPRMFKFMFTTKPEGHGFGLSAAHRTVLNHGGRMSVDSPVGSGAQFTVVLPLQGPGGSR